MIVWLDHLIFGNGRGTASPHFDQRFYWLSGELYSFSAGLGAQLHSWQWFHPLPGERRELCGKTFKPFSSYRKCGRVCVAWAMTDLSNCKTLEEQHALIRAFKTEIDRL